MKVEGPYPGRGDDGRVTLRYQRVAPATNEGPFWEAVERIAPLVSPRTSRQY